MLKIGKYVSFFERGKVKKGRVVEIAKETASVYSPDGKTYQKRLSSLVPLRGKPPNALRPIL
jgi:hypothetical protein